MIAISRKNINPSKILEIIHFIHTHPEFRDFGLNLSISFQKNSNAEEDFDRHIELDKIEADD